MMLHHQSLPGVSDRDTHPSQYCAQAICFFGLRLGVICFARLYKGVAGRLLLDVTGVDCEEGDVIYCQRSLFPISSCGILESFNTLANCDQPIGADVEVLFLIRSFTRSTMCELGIVASFRTSSPFALQRTLGLLFS